VFIGRSADTEVAMSRMRTGLMVLGAGVGLVGVLAGGGWLYMTSARDARYAGQHFETHGVDFPVPFPLTEAEIAQLREEKAAQIAAAAPPVDPKAKKTATDAGAPAPDPLEGVDLGAIAMERAVARGKHLVEARYVCVECHGKDFGGGTMIDAPPIGKILGPNLTAGAGSKTVAYKNADWDRIVRHGVKPDGTPAIMPSEDFFRMSDRELSDIVAYIRTMPAVEKEVPAPTFGPVGTVLVATGQIRLSAELHEDHQAAHVVEPPPEGPDATFGAHLINVCTGCHRAGLEGGPIVGGDPAWVPAGNITPHEQGIAGWTYEDFAKLMRQGVRPDGTAVQLPMAMIVPYGANMTDTELQAMWAYLQTVEPKADGI
jgi:mono/diheme cytochrome c family protein